MKSLKGGKFSSCFGAEKLKGSQLQEDFAPYFLTMGSAPVPSWGSAPRPVIGSRSRARCSPKPPNQTPPMSDKTLHDHSTTYELASNKHIDTIPACDGQTDRQTVRHTHTHTHTHKHTETQ